MNPLNGVSQTWQSFARATREHLFRPVGRGVIKTAEAVSSVVKELATDSFEDRQRKKTEIVNNMK